MIKDIIKDIIKDDKGVIIPLVALLIAVLLAFTAIVVEAGILYADRRQMVTAADAAALAGARELALGKSEDTAKKAAIEIAQKNNIIITKEDVKIEEREVTIPRKNIKDKREIVEVTAKRTRELFFARFIGHDNADVGAVSIATWGFIKEVNGGDILPLFLFDTTYGLKDVLHDGKVISNGKYAGGNWGYIDIEKNWPTLQELIAGTKKSTYHFEVDGIIESENGNKRSVNASVIERINAASKLSTAAERRQYMMGLVPIISEEGFLKLNLKKNETLDNPLRLPIVYFAVFEIEDIVDNKHMGYSGALDKPDYISNGKAQPYPGYENSTIVGSFADSVLSVDTVMQIGDQENPNPGGVRPAPYIRLIK